MQKAGSATAKFVATLKTVAANVGIMLAITAAIKVATWAWDKFNTTVGEAQSDLEDTQNTISSLKEQIKELEALEDASMTQGQKDKLENLKEQLKVQEQLEEIEKRRLARETVGNGNFADYFDKDSYKNAHANIMSDLTKYQKDMHENYNPFANSLVEQYKKDSESVKRKSVLVDAGLETDTDVSGLQESLRKAEEKQEKTRQEILLLQEGLISNKADIQAWINTIEGFISDGSLVGEDLTQANADLEALNENLKFVNEELTFINTLLYGGDDSWENVLLGKTQYSLKNLRDFGFTDSELEILSTLTFDKNATLLELKTILDESQKKAEEEKVEVPLTYVQQMSGIQSLSKGLNQLDSIMADVIDGEDFDYSSILNNTEFSDTFGEYKDEYEEFIETITNSPTDLSKCQKAFDNLASAYVYSSNAITNLTEETKEAAILELEQMGIANAREVVENKLNAQRDAELAQKQYLQQIGKVLIEQGWEEIENYLNQAGASNEAKQEVFKLKMAQMALNGVQLDLSSNISQVLTYAKACGVASAQVELLAKMEEVQKAYQAGDVHAISEFNRLSRELKNTDWDSVVTTSFTPVKYEGGINSLAAAQENLKDATKDATDALEKEKEALEELRNKMDTLHDAIMWFYDQQIDKINDKIDKINEENEILQEQQENMDRIIAAIEDNYDVEIKKIQDKIDVLKDENDEEERALALEEAKRKLQEAKSRKTLMVYQKGVGFTYQVDTKAITEAEEELEELQENEVVVELEKQIEKLEEAKQKWSEIPEAYEKAMQEIAAKNYFGKNWKELTLNPSDDLLNKFEGKYTGIQSSIDKNEDRIERYEKEIDKLEELKQAWEDAKNAYQYAEYEKQLSSYFGSDYEYQLLNNSTVWRQQYAAEYANLCAQIEAMEQKIKAANDATANAATTNAQTVKTATDETVKASEALGTAVSTAENATSSVVSEAGAKVDNIAQVISTLKDTIGELILNIDTLYGTLASIDQITLDNIMSQFGISGSSNGSFDGGMVVTGVMTKASDSGESSGGAGLLGAINAVIEAIGQSGGESGEGGSGLLGLLGQVNMSDLSTIIGKFGGSSEDGSTTDDASTLLGAINAVSNSIIGEGKGNDQSGLIPSIETLGSESTTNNIVNVVNSFNDLYKKIAGCIVKVNELISAIEAIPSVPSINGSNGTGTAFTFGTGTAFSGTAYASGTGKWGLPSDKPGSLVAEQGSEIVVRDGKYRLISSPTLMDLKKGDIVFNHKQTEAILKNGKRSVIDNLANKSEKIVNNLNGFAYSAGTVTGNAFDAILNGLQLMLQPKNVLPKFAQKFKKLPNNLNEQKVEIHIGDIHVHGVQNVNGLADQIINHLPNTMLQKLNKK